MLFDVFEHSLPQHRLEDERRGRRTLCTESPISIANLRRYLERRTRPCKSQTRVAGVKNQLLGSVHPSHRHSVVIHGVAARFQAVPQATPACFVGTDRMATWIAKICSFSNRQAHLTQSCAPQCGPRLPAATLNRRVRLRGLPGNIDAESAWAVNVSNA